MTHLLGYTSYMFHTIVYCEKCGLMTLNVISIKNLNRYMCRRKLKLKFVQTFETAEK